jgi:hypothetical protein
MRHLENTLLRQEQLLSTLGFAGVEDCAPKVSSQLFQQDKDIAWRTNSQLDKPSISLERSCGLRPPESMKSGA